MFSTPVPIYYQGELMDRKVTDLSGDITTSDPFPQLLSQDYRRDKHKA